MVSISSSSKGLDSTGEDTHAVLDVALDMGIIYTLGHL
jgi:hypothetical protein